MAVDKPESEGEDTECEEEEIHHGPKHTGELNKKFRIDYKLSPFTQPCAFKVTYQIILILSVQLNLYSKQ